MSKEQEIEDLDTLKFIALGGGNEVGRSCHILEYKGKVIMLDAGVHPAYTGISALPFYDDYDLSKVDILLISHFHLDHAASLPFVMQHTEFKGRVFMTHPTKAIYRYLLGDFVKVTSISSGGNGSGANTSAALYTDEDLVQSFDRIETVDYHSTIECDGIRFTAYHAGHVLGAAMYFIEIGGLKILFTGDFSREESRHLNAAEVPPLKPDLLIAESTFGTATHEPRQEKELRLTNLIHSTLVKGGRVLLPVFALGTAQELMLILEDYWNQHANLEHVNIYFASSLAKKCLPVFQAYVNMMNDNIRRQFRDTNTNPFQFRHIKNIKNLDKFEDFGPCVVVAAPGMLQNGVSRDLLERWAPDAKNSVILTGYSVEGTLAKNLITEPDMIPSQANPDQMIPRRLTIEEISFAAHVDYEQNAKFIDEVDPKTIILVHGESNPMGRLKSALLSKYSKFKGTDNEVKVYNPKNCDEVFLKFKGLKIIKALGSIVKEKESNVINGVLVAKDFEMNLMKVDDVREFSTLTSTVVKERQTLRIDAGRDLIAWHLRQMFGFIDVLIDDKEEWECRIMGEIVISLVDGVCVIEWVSGIINDSIADSVVAILMSVESSPASVKLSSKTHNHSHGETENESPPKTSEDGEIKNEESMEVDSVAETAEQVEDQEQPDEPRADLFEAPTLTGRIEHIQTLLRVHFGDSFIPHKDCLGCDINIGQMTAKIDYQDLSVLSKSGVLKRRIEMVLKRAVALSSTLAVDGEF
ncbi:hypothetical protein WICPIJ_007775 [Wickerhamomyces pijperi]|uniref:Endoribonuclease YSH1 n=1 Tax=Wickerhamomyces pijperi TaxID=599730 RepID=A0A9P8Q165_WICPI|nr:hypothetical protein WICPIJ_007775 [Wickerhamomyces pijperi]